MQRRVQEFTRGGGGAGMDFVNGGIELRAKGAEKIKEINLAFEAYKILGQRPLVLDPQVHYVDNSITPLCKRLTVMCLKLCI